jgi:hypothetical protein
VRYRNRRFYCAVALDLSTDGMYLEVQNVTLPTGTLVELEFDTPGRSWLIPAIVVHHHNCGIGLMFRDRQTDLFQELVIQGSAHQPLPRLEAGQASLSKR